MKLNDAQRATVENALDKMQQFVPAHERDTVSAYTKAIAIIREKPAGMRRIRSDFNTKRPTPQMEIAP